MAACAIPASAWIVQACSPTAPQLFAPDVSLPLFDSSPPALTFDSGVEPVRVVLASAAGPIGNATVVFHDGGGKVIGTTTTDAAGHAEKILPAGTGVTILFGDPQTKLQAVTYLGVEPGDVLVALDKTISPPNTSVTVTDIPASPPANTYQYASLVGNCSNYFFAPPSTMALYGSCVNPSLRFPLIIEAFDPNAQSLGYAYRKDLALDFDAGASPSMADAAWSTAHVNWTVALTGPALQSFPFVVTSEVASFVPHTVTQTPFTDTDGGVTTSPVQMHVGYADFVQSEVQISSSNGVGSTFDIVATRTPPPTKDSLLPIDVTKLPPSISKMTSDYTTPQPTVTFTPDAPITNGSGTFVVFDWSNTNEAGTTINRWTIIAPPTMTTITAPELPPANVDWSSKNMTGFNTPTVTVMSFDALKSYADFRRAAATIPPADYFTQSTGAPAAPLLPIDGTITITSVGPFIE
jgi:hypothetical protein